jgi:hypothetical protein
MLAASNVLHQTHEEAVFPGGVDDYRRDLRLTECHVCLKAALSIGEVVGLPVDWFIPAGNFDRLLQADGRDIRNDALKDDFIPAARIEDVDLVYRDHLHVRIWFVHAASMSVVRCAIPTKKSRVSKR